MSSRLRLVWKQHRIVAVALATALVVAPAAVIASDRFLDVPNSNIFHDDISAMADAGITLGCGGPYYCPEVNVTREQMAGFLNRGLPRTAVVWGVLPFEFTHDGYVTGLDFETGGAAGGTGFVIVEADVSAWSNSTTHCPCDVFMWIDHFADEGAELLGTSPVLYFDLSGTVSGDGFTDNAGSVSWVFEVPTGSIQEFWLAAAVTPSGTPTEGANEAVQGIMTATYVPYGTLPPAGPFGPSTEREVERPVLSRPDR